MDKPFHITDSNVIARLIDEKPIRAEVYEESTVYYYADGGIGIYNRRTTTTEWLHWYPPPHRGKA